MRAACPTPVSVVEEEAPSSRSVGGYSSPGCHARMRVTKGLTTRRPPVSDSEDQDIPLPSKKNFRGRNIFSRRSLAEMMHIGFTTSTHVLSPRSEDQTSRNKEVGCPIQTAVPYDYEEQSFTDMGLSCSENEIDDESLYNLSVTGRNPVLSESNVIDWQPPTPIRLPTKATSAEHQSWSPTKEDGCCIRNRKTMPLKSLNIGGLGLPFPNEPQRSSSRDYKPGRIVQSAFDCFRCETRMSAHDAHEWFESILISSRVRGVKRSEKVKDIAKGKDKKYSNDEISRALYPRYWSKKCLSPSPRPQSHRKAPDTRPPTQTPDTISGPWRAVCSRADSRDGMFRQMTREDLQGFCGGHDNPKCPSGRQEQKLAPCRPYYSDTHLGVNFMTCGDLWCHNADIRIEACTRGKPEVDSYVAESASRPNMSRMSQNGKTSRLSVHSRDGHINGKTSAFEIQMRMHCENPEDVFYELHEDDEEDDDVSGMTTVHVDYSLTPNQMSGQCQSCCSGLDYDEIYQREDEEHDSRCQSMTNTTLSCSCSSCSNVANDPDCTYIRRCQCSNVRCCVMDTNQTFRPTSVNDSCNGNPSSKHMSQIDCNTSAVEGLPSLEIKGKKASAELTVRDIRRAIQKDFKRNNECMNEEPVPQSLEEISVPETETAEDILARVEDLENEIESFPGDIQVDDDEVEAEEPCLDEERHSCYFRRICDSSVSRNHNNQTFPDLPQPLGRHFCYMPIVDKRYNRWRRRKPKKRKRHARKVRKSGGKTPSSTSDESTTGIDGRESKRGKRSRSRKHGCRSRRRKTRHASRNETRGQEQEGEEEPDEEILEPTVSLQFDPTFDQSGWDEETQFPESTEACTNSSKSSLTSSGTRTSTEPNTRESFISPCPVTFVDIADLSLPSINVRPVDSRSRTSEHDTNPELVLEQSRARSRVASIPSKKFPRTQKSLLSLSLRGPTIEKEMSAIDPMQALPRAGGRLPLLRTQRSVLARSSDSAMPRIPRNVSYLSRMERRLGWIKRGIMQKPSNQTIISLPKTDLKLAAEKYIMSPPPKSPVPKTRMTKGTKNKSGIPRHSKASTDEQFSSIVRGQKKQGSSKRKEARRSSHHNMMSVYLADKEYEDEDYPTFTLNDLLSSLPESRSKSFSKRQYDKYAPKRTPPDKLASLFNNYVKGSPLYQRKLQRPQMERSISALSFTPAFTFSIYTLPQAYRNHNISLDKAAH